MYMQKTDIIRSIYNYNKVLLTFSLHVSELHGKPKYSFDFVVNWKENFRIDCFTASLLFGNPYMAPCSYHQHGLCPGNLINLHASLHIDHQHGHCMGNHVNLHGSLLIDYWHDQYPGNRVNLHGSLLIDYWHDQYPGNHVNLHGSLLIDYILA